MPGCRFPAAVLLLAACAYGQTKLLVTVVEPKSGKPVTRLKAADFAVFDDKSPISVREATAGAGDLDIMLLLDTSLAGGAVQPVASGLIAQLGEKDQMSIVSFDSSAEVIQEFTSSRELLSRAVSQVKYGNTPRLLDAIYAAIEGGFENTIYRRVILLLTAGLEGGSRVTDKQVLKLARKNGVTIVPVFVAGQERRLFADLARQTGGASLNLNDLRKSGVTQAGPRVFETLRQYYVLTLNGNLALGDRVRVEVTGPEKLFVSALPLE